MRSDDPYFGEVCDRVGQNKITPEDEQFFKGRILETDLENHNDNFKNGKIAIIVTTNAHREEINLEKLEKLLPNQPTYTCNSTDRALNISDAPKVPKNTPYTQTGSLPSELKIKVGAPVVITTNHRIKRFKEDGMMNGARGFVEHVEVSEEDPEEVSIIWIVFNNKDFGNEYRNSPEHLKLRRNQPLSKEATPILPVKKTFKLKAGHNTELQRKQFPLTLGYTSTNHKIQGQTLEAVIVDFRDGFIVAGGVYVAITRVRNRDSLFLRDFDKSYIKTANEVNAKIEEMRKERPYIFSKLSIQNKCFQIDDTDFKVGYININDLTSSSHSKYLNFDKNLMNLEILCIADSRLTSREDSEYLKDALDNWVLLHRFDCQDGRKHMGLLIMTPKTKINLPRIQTLKFENEDEIRNAVGVTRVQILNVINEGDRYSFIYCQITPNETEVAQIENITQYSDYILGDMNLNPEKPDQLQKLKNICGEFKTMHLRAVTYIPGRNQLDHIIVRKDHQNQLFSECYFNFVSDHKSIVLRKSKETKDEPIKVDTTKGEKELTKVNLNEKNQVKTEPKSVRTLDEETYSKSYTSLNGNNWLNDDVIDGFFHLLMRKYGDIFIFSSYFSYNFLVLKRNYDYVKRFDKSADLFKCRLVMFPLLQYSHWFLCFMDTQRHRLCILDPYIDREENRESITKTHLEELNKIEMEFLKIHFESKGNCHWRDLKKSVLLPPFIPEQLDGSQCGVFLISFARYKLELTYYHIFSSTILGNYESVLFVSSFTNWLQTSVNSNGLPENI